MFGRGLVEYSVDIQKNQIEINKRLHIDSHFNVYLSVYL